MDYRPLRQAQDEAGISLLRLEIPAFAGMDGESCNIPTRIADKTWFVSADAVFDLPDQIPHTPLMLTPP